MKGFHNFFIFQWITRQDVNLGSLILFSTGYEIFVDFLLKGETRILVNQITRYKYVSTSNFKRKEICAKR